MTIFDIIRNKVKIIPNNPYGWFTEEETETLDAAKHLICGQDIEKRLLFDSIIEAYVKNAANGEAYSNAGPSI